MSSAPLSQERETAGSVQDEWHTGSSEKETNSIKIWGESHVGPAGSPKTSNPRLNVDKTSTRGGSCSEAIDRPRCRERSCSPLQGDTASNLRKGVLPGKRSGTYATSHRKARQISIYLSILPVVACATVPYNVQVPLGVSPTLPLPPPRAARLSRSSNSPRATKTQAPPM